jgi:hypothetical protein
LIQQEIQKLFGPGAGFGSGRGRFSLKHVQMHIDCLAAKVIITQSQPCERRFQRPMGVIHTEIPWRRWLKRSRALLPVHDSIAELSRLRVRELHISRSLAAAFVECQPSMPLEKLWPMAEAATLDLATAQFLPGDRVVISFDLADCFSHMVDVPRAALADAEGILGLERQRVTPFSQEDVYALWAPAADVSPGDTIPINQILIKKSAVARIVEALRAIRCEPVALIARSSGSPATRMALGFDGKPFGTTAYRFWGRAAACMATLLTLSMSLLTFGQLNRQESYIAEIEARTSETAKAASVVQERLKAITAASADLSAAQALVAARPRVTEAIEALSSELPDDTSLEGFTYVNDVFTVTGTSEAPQPLVALLEETAAFTAAGFSAPVFKNPGEPRSHFTLTFKLEAPRGAQP